MKNTDKLDFGSLTGLGVKIAIIDSGVDSEHIEIGPIAHGADIRIDSDGQIVLGTDYVDRLGHGTACTGIIRHIAPDAEIHIVRIFEQSLVADGRVLIEALQWVIDQGIDVVNLSLGTTDRQYFEPIRELCRQAARENIILVAAAHNRGIESYPAILPNVIGVQGRPMQTRNDLYFQAEKNIECIAHGGEQILCWRNSSKIIAAGSSFAASRIAGIICLIRQVYPCVSLDAIRKILSLHSLSECVESIQDDAVSLVIKEPILPSKTKEIQQYPCIGRAALFAIHKELENLMRFEDLLDFDIHRVVDPLKERLVRYDDSDRAILLDSELSACLREVLENADTLIIGDMSPLSRVVGRDVLAEVAHRALENNVNIFSCLPSKYYHDLFAIADKKGLKIFNVQLDIEEIVRGHFYFQVVDVPVIGVFGTQAHCDTFRVQLKLFKELAQMGYNVGQIGTENYAELFDLDFVFPIGLADQRDMSEQHYTSYLSYKLHELNRTKRPDIVLFSTRSTIIPDDISKPDLSLFQSIGLLTGLKPDASILVVDACDPDDYIQDAIEALRIMGQSATILLVLVGEGMIFGQNLNLKSDRYEYRDRMDVLKRKCGISVVDIQSHEAAKKMAEIVIDYFGS